MSKRNIRKLVDATDALSISDDLDLSLSSSMDIEPKYDAKSIFSKVPGFEVDSESEQNEEQKNTDKEEYSSDMRKKGKKKRRTKNKETCATTKQEPVASTSKQDDGIPLDEAEEIRLGQASGARPKRTNKKKKSKAKADPNKDDIGNYLKELKDLLIAHPEPVETIPASTEDPQKKLMAVKNKYLNYKNAIDSLAEKKRSRRHDANYNKNIIVFLGENIKSTPGLSMTIIKNEDNIVSYAFIHNKQYIKGHFNFLNQILKNRTRNVVLLKDFILSNLHIEGMLELLDIYLLNEIYDDANNIHESIIHSLQRSFHPGFILTNPDVRLPYEYMENRPFYIAVLKYLYLLSERGFHRCSLELAKLLLNLDPNDQLNMYQVIDVMALKAREYQWLIDLIDSMGGIGLMSGIKQHLKYSYALSKFLIATKNKESTDIADKLLKDAILSWPLIAKEIMNRIPDITKGDYQNHILYNGLIDYLNKNFMHIKLRAQANNNIKLFVTIYVKLTFTRWSDTLVVQWFVRNAQEVVEEFHQKAEKIVHEQIVRTIMFCTPFPSNSLRHIAIIRSLNHVVFDGLLPGTVRPLAFDPLSPKNTIDRYGYIQSVRDALRRQTDA